MSEKRTLPVQQAGAPVMSKRGPYIVEVEAGETYLWCSCGRSKTQPWCDQSHAGTGFEPIEFVAPISGEFHICGCRQSENKPFCFGTCRGHTPENSKWDLL
ncbi:MAG: CDGSH iron-sulfur domain-containing protein [Anderseniella sp.]|jgi:CDGSH-type Zn-finger protein